MPRFKGIKELTDELGGLGAEITITGTLAGIVEYGQTVQLELPDKTFVYIPFESIMRFVK
jgi:hypothetical protein